MQAWWMARQWETVFAAAQLSVLPAVLGVALGALLALLWLGAGAQPRSRKGRVGKRAAQLLAWLLSLLLAALILLGYRAAPYTADAVLTVGLRRALLDLLSQLGLGLLVVAGPLLLWSLRRRPAKGARA